VGTDEQGGGQDGPFPERPAWWVDAVGRDAKDTEADERAGERDRAAVERDQRAVALDARAVQREQDAVDLAARTHERYDRQEAAQLELQINAERVRRDQPALDRIRDSVQARPELAAAFEQVLEHVEELYIGLVESGYQTDNARSDLRSLAQLLAAAAADRRAAEEDRAHAEKDRAAARSDRDNARSSRQQAALDRAPRGLDHD